MEFATGLACTFRGIVHLAATPSLWGWAGLIELHGLAIDAVARRGAAVE